MRLAILAGDYIRTTLTDTAPIPSSRSCLLHMVGIQTPFASYFTIDRSFWCNLKINLHLKINISYLECLYGKLV